MPPVAAPTITADPAQPGDCECRDISGDPSILGTFQYGDPADVTDTGIRQIVDNAVNKLATWHRIAIKRPTMVPYWQQVFFQETFSGHKLHIACTMLYQVRQVARLVLPVCWRAGLGMKAAIKPDALTNRKGVVVYLPRRATVDRDTSLIAAALDTWQPSADATITGDTHLNGPLWWRWEFGTNLPTYDVDRYEYRRLYTPASA